MLSTYLISIACERARSVRGDKKGWTAHLIGANKCLYASNEARDCAWKANGTEIVTSSKHARSSSAANASHQPHKQFKSSQLSIRPYAYKLNDLPFNPAEQEAVQAQAARAIYSTNSAFTLFQDPEMLELLRLMQTAAPSIMPSGKSAGGLLLDNAARAVEQKLVSALKDQDVGLV